MAALPPPDPRKDRKVIVLVCSVAIAVWALLSFAAYLALCSWHERGALGDMFGVANSLFTCMAFVGVVYSLYRQDRELLRQRTEFELQRQRERKAAEPLFHVYSTICSPSNAPSELELTFYNLGAPVNNVTLSSSPYADVSITPSLPANGSGTLKVKDGSGAPLPDVALTVYYTDRYGQPRTMYFTIPAGLAQLIRREGEA